MDNWKEARAYIADALEYAKGTHQEQDILFGIYQGQFQFWRGERSAIVTELIDYPLAKCCRFFLAGGDLAELRDMEQEIIAWAKSLGCTRVEVAGREGWIRALEGYSRLCTVIVKDI